MPVKISQLEQGHMLEFESIHDQRVYCHTAESTLFELKYYQHKLRDELSAVGEQIATSEASLDYLKLASRRV